MTATIRVTGGHRLNRYVRQQEREARRQPHVEVGYFDKRISILAANLEFGNPRTSLPERPAFRYAIDQLPKVLQPVLRQELKRTKMIVTPDLAKRLAVIARDTIKQIYMDFHSPAGLSERQKARKKGSPYEHDELIGAQGPRLIEHITAYVDGQQV